MVYMHTCMVVSIKGNPSNIKGVLVLGLWCPKQLSSVTDMLLESQGARVVEY